MRSVIRPHPAARHPACSVSPHRGQSRQFRLLAARSVDGSRAHHRHRGDCRPDDEQHHWRLPHPRRRARADQRRIARQAARRVGVHAGALVRRSLRERVSRRELAPSNTQTTIGQAANCVNDTGVAIANTACVLFNSRGIPVAPNGAPPNVGAPTADDALYVTDGTAVYGMTVSATGQIRLWRTNPTSTPAWVLQ
jgi:hypothetical protein